MAQSDRRPPAPNTLPTHDEAGQIPNERVLQAHEQERLRLAREIHDGPAQILANAIFELEYFEKLLERDPGAARGQLTQMKKDIRNGLGDIRRFIFDLRPPALAEMGLFPALAHYTEEYEKQFGISVEARLPGSQPRLPGGKELAVFRIVQEALQNVRKHAVASRIVMVGGIQGRDLRISVEDNGRGFDPTEVSGRLSKNFGLTSMRERAELIDADLEIESAPGRGTIVTLVVAVE
jgi:two-component system sensor histidine kinase DegS